MTPPPASAARLRAGIAAPAPLRLPPAPRRVSGPAQRTRAAERPVTGFAAVVIRLIDHPWLERLVRGRAWIAIVATALLGIVAMQVALLRLGAQVGSQTTAVNQLIQRNAATVATIGGLEANSGLGIPASSLGMLYPPPGAVTYLQLSPGDAQRAAERMTAPSAAAIAAAAAHPPRATTTSTPPATNKVGTRSSITGAAAGTSVGATGAAGTASTVPQTSGTAAAGGSAGTNTAATTTANTTAGTFTTTQGTTQTTPSAPSTTASGTQPPTTAAGGAAATGAAGGATAPTTGANSGASVAPGATSTGG
jgi:hypothetical protein